MHDPEDKPFPRCASLLYTGRHYAQIHLVSRLLPLRQRRYFGIRTGTRRRSARRARYQAAVQAGPLALHAFLDQFPKGADLHIHLSGAVYAETFIRDAGEDGLCVDPAALSFAKPPCTPPLVEAAQVPAHQKLYDRLVDAFQCAALWRPRASAA